MRGFSSFFWARGSEWTGALACVHIYRNLQASSVFVVLQVSMLMGERVASCLPGGLLEAARTHCRRILHALPLTKVSVRNIHIRRIGRPGWESALKPVGYFGSHSADNKTTH